VAITDLNPNAGQGEVLCAAVSVATQQQLAAWLSGEVNARGITPSWTPALAWWVDRAGMTYRDPVEPPAGAPAPTSGQGWPR